jgi:hypothetical protein
MTETPNPDTARHQERVDRARGLYGQAATVMLAEDTAEQHGPYDDKARSTP